MKRKYFIFLVVLGAVCLLLPFFIEDLYDIGEKYPIITTRFSASDLLSYLSCVIGLFISMIAIILSLQTNDIDLQIKHAHTFSENDKEAIWMEIINNSAFECQIISVELADLKNRHFHKIFNSAPFTIKAKNSHIVVVEEEKIRKILSRINLNKKNKIRYCIRTSLNKTLYLKSDELFKRLEETEIHNKRLMNLVK